MRSAAIVCLGLWAMLGLALAANSAVAATTGKAAKRGVVIATSGTRGVVLVGADHQARKIGLRHRMKSLVPGAVIRYSEAQGEGREQEPTIASGRDRRRRRPGRNRQAGIGLGVVAKGTGCVWPTAPG